MAARLNERGFLRAFLYFGLIVSVMGIPVDSATAVICFAVCLAGLAVSSPPDPVDD